MPDFSPLDGSPLDGDDEVVVPPAPPEDVPVEPDCPEVLEPSLVDVDDDVPVDDVLVSATLNEAVLEESDDVVVVVSVFVDDPWFAPALPAPLIAEVDVLVAVSATF